MDNKFEIPDDKFNALIFDLLLQTKIELQAMRNTIAILYGQYSDDDSFLSIYSQQLKETEAAIGAQIKAHYSGFDIDRFLSDALEE